MTDKINMENNFENKAGMEQEQIKKDQQKKNKYKNHDFSKAKGVETMFRTAFQAQLDMISLAATKANIMISINGFLATVLTISEAFIYASEPVFLLPTIVFLLTAASSIFFAIRASSPDLHHIDLAIKGNPTLDDFICGNANLLNFEHYAKLSKQDYITGMNMLMQDPEKVYERMSDYLYWLGTIAQWKFRMLRYSYMFFRFGIILGIVSAIALQVYVNLIPKPEIEHAEVTSNHFAAAKHLLNIL